jgi:hypothetical protein
VDGGLLCRSFGTKKRGIPAALTAHLVVIIHSTMGIDRRPPTGLKLMVGVVV